MADLASPSVGPWRAVTNRRKASACSSSLRSALMTSEWIRYPERALVVSSSVRTRTRPIGNASPTPEGVPACDCRFCSSIKIRSIASALVDSAPRRRRRTRGSMFQPRSTWACRNEVLGGGRDLALAASQTSRTCLVNAAQLRRCAEELVLLLCEERVLLFDLLLQFSQIGILVGELIVVFRRTTQNTRTATNNAITIVLPMSVSRVRRSRARPRSAWQWRSPRDAFARRWSVWSRRPHLVDEVPLLDSRLGGARFPASDPRRRRTELRAAEQELLRLVAITPPRRQFRQARVLADPRQVGAQRRGQIPKRRAEAMTRREEDVVEALEPRRRRSFGASSSRQQE